MKYEHRGKRSCLIISIIYKDTQAAAPTNRVADQDPEAHSASLLHDTLGIFKGGNKQTEDYHGMFDTTYFIDWICQVLEKSQYL